MGRCFAGIMLLLFAVGGCQNSVNHMENAEKNAQVKVIADKRFVTDSFLRDRLLLTGLVVADTEDGLLRVQVTAVNVRTGFFSQMWSGITGENPYRIQYKFTWLDKDGMAVRSVGSTWKEYRVIPGEGVYIQSVAPSRECRDFNISLKEAE